MENCTTPNLLLIDPRRSRSIHETKYMRSRKKEYNKDARSETERTEYRQSAVGKNRKDFSEKPDNSKASRQNRI